MTNVVLLVWCSVRADHTFILDYERNTTPFLKGLAEESYVFPHAITQSFWSLPSLATILTGKYSYQHGMTMQLAIETRSCFNRNKMLSESLKELGFSTWTYVDDDWINERTGFTKGVDFFKDYPPPNGRGRAAIVLNDIKETFRPENPFFLFINLLDAHDPYIVPEEFHVWAGERDHGLDVDKYFTKGEHWGEDTWQQVIDRYDEALLWLDHNAGELWRWMQEQGYLDDTIFIVLSDHGEYLGEHGLYQHTCSFYDELLRVPLIIWTSEGTPYVVDEQFELRKLYNLILNVAQGLPLVPETSKYTLSECPVPRNIMRVFKRVNPDYQNPRLFSAKVSVRSKEWKYIWNSHVEDELYLLPDETTNIFNVGGPLVNRAIDFVEKTLGQLPWEVHNHLPGAKVEYYVP